MKQALLLVVLFYLQSAIASAQSVWQSYEPALPEVVGAFHLRTSSIAPSVAWTICAKYDVTANSYTQIFLDSLIFTKTSDGGETWEGGRIPMGLEPYGNSICPINADTAWATGLDSDFASYLLKTTDGGETWLRYLENGFIGADSYINFVHFFDDQHGVVMGDPAEAAPGSDPFFEIYTTSDGGETWERVSVEDIPPRMPNEFGVDHLFDARGDTIWFGTYNGTTFSHLRIFRSTDKGATWSAFASNSHWPFSFADGQYGVGARQFTSIQTQLRLTTDGGVTWTALPSLNLGILSSIAMMPGSRYIVAVLRTNNITGPFRTMLSTNLGQTWMQIGDGTQHAGNIHFSSPAIGYAGEWQPADHPTRMYRWAGNPLSGLFSGKELDAEVEVFPNPGEGIINIKATILQPSDFLILINDAQGMLVERRVVEKTSLLNAQFDLHSQPAGAYTVTICTEHGSLTRRFLKQ